MKTSLHVSVLVLLLLATANPCFAMMSIEQVSKSRAKELGLEIQSKGAGPDAIFVQLEFDVKGDLKQFARVDLDINDGQKLQLSASLKEERPKPDRIAVSFSASPTQLANATLRVVTGFSTNYSGHDIRLKDFVNPQNAAPAAPAATAVPAAAPAAAPAVRSTVAVPAAASTVKPEEEARFLAIVRKAFDTRDPAPLTALTYWDRVPEKQKKGTDEMYANLVTDKEFKPEFKLIAPELNFIDRGRVEDGVTYSFNLPITKQLEMKMKDARDDKTLGIITFAVGEKDGKMLLLGFAPAK